MGVVSKDNIICKKVGSNAAGRGHILREACVFRQGLAVDDAAIFFQLLT